jgi:hypothetical protein
MITKLKIRYMGRPFHCISTDKSKAITADSCGQNPVSSLDVVHLDIVEDACNNQHDEQVCDTVFPNPLR